jgi:hypothetical protein
MMAADRRGAKPRPSRTGIVAFLAVAGLAVACNGGDKPSPTATSAPTPSVTVDRFAAAAAIEAAPAPDLPGQYVNLPEAFAEVSTLAHYGASSGPNTNAHVTHDVDYSPEATENAANGLPPAGGPHWGAGRCGNDPNSAPAFCGPAPWGIYRDPWNAESLVHNMEHAGVVVWYNTTSASTRDQLEAEVKKRLESGDLVVMTPYPDLPPETIALTAWARRDVFPVSEYDDSRVDQFIRTFSCRFDPEGFC